jgi:D-alanyl-D-alanine carboxypeptidase (penicillin-binding protein 5/6)
VQNLRRRSGGSFASALALVLAVAMSVTAVGPGVANATRAPEGVSRATTAATTTTAAADIPQGWILVDGDSGKVLGGGAMHTPRLTASTIKLVNALTVVEHVPMNGTLTVSALAAGMPSSRAGMVAGQVWPVSSALEVMMMISANDAAYALAERAAGSIDAFSTLATATAKRLGMNDTTIGDPAGLDDQGRKSTSSPYDLAIAARNIFAVPQLAKWAATPSTTLVEPSGQTVWLTHHNKLLTEYTGANGMKDGFTKIAGRTLVATATRDGRTMIAVVMGVYDWYGWAKKLLDQGFNTPVASETSTDVLPTARVVPYATRQYVASGLPSLLGAPKVSAVGAAVATGPPAVDAAGTPATTVGPATTAAGTKTTAGVTSAGSGAGHGTKTAGSSGATPTTLATSSSGGDGITGIEWFLIVAVLLMTLFFARREQIKARKRRRLAARRAVMLAQRRPGAPGGRPRPGAPRRRVPPGAPRTPPGTRDGQSHVRTSATDPRVSVRVGSDVE